jgi:hypothetical protein
MEDVAWTRGLRRTTLRLLLVRDRGAGFVELLLDQTLEIG